MAQRHPLIRASIEAHTAGPGAANPRSCPPLEPERLTRRGRIDHGPALPTGPSRGLLREILAFLFLWPRPVQPLPRDSPENPIPGKNLPYSRTILDREQTRRALERAKL